jgi:hypothetical protein
VRSWLGSITPGNTSMWPTASWLTDHRKID